MLDAYKELEPVVYGENAIKYLYFEVECGRMCFQMHWHDRMELLCVSSGILKLHLREGILNLYPGQIAVINSGQLHGGFYGNEGVAYHTIMFDVKKFLNGTIASGKYLTPLSRNRIFFQTIIEDERLLEIVERIVTMQKNREEIHPLSAIGAIYEMIGILYGHCEKNVCAAEIQDAAFGEILKYINERYTEEISAGKVSLKFGYNESYFCRRFKAITGIHYSKYVQALRMERAQQLLRDGREPIGDVAWKCGFADVSYFTKCFRRLFGFTPTQYRERKV